MFRDMILQYPPRTFLLTGTRSQLGAAVLPLLAARGDAVVAIAQEAGTNAPNLRWVTGRLPGIAVPTPPQGFDAILSFGPMEKLAEWLTSQTERPARRVIATSSMSAVSKQSARFEEDRDIAQRLLSGEQSLRAACARWQIPCLILRPTMIYGLGLDQNLSSVVRASLRRKVFIAPQSDGLRQPVHAQDVATAALRAALLPTALEETIEIGGGERLTVRDMFRRVHRSMPRHTLFVPAPLPMMRFLGAVSKRFRGAVSRLEVDLIADNARLHAALDMETRGFAPTAETWRNV